jgi:hypothetical protein
MCGTVAVLAQAHPTSVGAHPSIVARQAGLGADTSLALVAGGVVAYPWRLT